MVRDLLIPKVSHVLSNMPESDAICPGNDALLNFVAAIETRFEGPEHTEEVGGANAQPSRCTLALFHAPMDAANAPAGLGYVSNDGHHFSCRNPVVL